MKRKAEEEEERPEAPPPRRQAADNQLHAEDEEAVLDMIDDTIALMPFEFDGRALISFDRLDMAALVALDPSLGIRDAVQTTSLQGTRSSSTTTASLSESSCSRRSTKRTSSHRKTITTLHLQRRLLCPQRAGAGLLG